jgi:hypothetical protein
LRAIFVTPKSRVSDNHHIHTPLEQPLVHTIATKACFLSSFRDGDSAIHSYGPPFIEPSSLGNIRVFEILQASAGAGSTGFALA